MAEASAPRVGNGSPAAPLFGDALGGAGGMADPVEPVFSSSLAADVFPDALSALPLPGLPSVAPAPLTPMPPPPPAAPPRATRAVRAQPPRPWEQYPPPGQPAHRPPPNVPLPAGPPAQLAPPSGRRPTAGVGYQRPASPTAPVRPPAYLPQNQGMAQIRAALTQARGQVRGPAGTTAPPGASRANRPAARARKRSGASGAWGSLVVVVIVLVSSGAGQKIISAISDLLQRK